MIKFKEGVRVGGIQAVTITALGLIDDYWGDVFDKDLMITSVTDGKHMEGSLHYKGLAADIRTWRNTSGLQMTKGQKAEIAYDLRSILGDDWDVVVESSHIHIEYDKKGSE